MRKTSAMTLATIPLHLLSVSSRFWYRGGGFHVHHGGRKDDQELPSLLARKLQLREKRQWQDEDVDVQNHGEGSLHDPPVYQFHWSVVDQQILPCLADMRCGEVRFQTDAWPVKKKSEEQTEPDGVFHLFLDGEDLSTE